MIETLRQHLINRLGKDTDNLEIVINCFKPVITKRNVFIVKEGEICQNVYFIVKGCLQVFVYDKDTNEITRDIVTEGTWCSDLISFGSGKPSTENIRTVEPCELLAIDRQSFQKMLETVPQFEKIYKKLLENSYANSVYRINTLNSLSGLERIKWLMEFRPKLMTRVSSKLIASYLGINKDTFSRLKRQL